MQGPHTVPTSRKPASSCTRKDTTLDNTNWETKFRDLYLDTNEREWREEMSVQVKTDKEYKRTNLNKIYTHGMGSGNRQAAVSRHDWNSKEDVNSCHRLKVKARREFLSPFSASEYCPEGRSLEISLRSVVVCSTFKNITRADQKSYPYYYFVSPVFIPYISQFPQSMV